MPWFKTEAWRDILETADLWRDEATGYIDDPTNRPKSLGTLTHCLMALLDAHTHIDPSPLWNLWQQIETQTGVRPVGVKVGRKELETMMMQCVGVLERLKYMGIVRDKPKGIADTKTDKQKNLVPRNPDVAKLALKIKRDLPKGGTKEDIALEFAENDKKKADTLLRQLRPDRYGHLLD